MQRRAECPATATHVDFLNPWFAEESNTTFRRAANVLLDAGHANILRWVLERSGRLQSAERAVPTYVPKNFTNLLSA